MSEEPSPAVRRGFDPISALLATATTLLLFWAAWLRFGPGGHPEPPAIGAVAPALKLLDPKTSDPLVLLGLRGKIVWLTFYSTVPGGIDLAALEKVWKQLNPHTCFAFAALAVDSDQPDRLRASIASAHTTFPAYLSSPETTRAFGARRSTLPLHILLDASGRVDAVAHGADPATLTRLSKHARLRLEEIEPMGRTRFASSD